jgi:signal transduction histidine kinase
MTTNVIPIPARSEAHRRALAQRRASILEERRRSFLRLASHELRTPLNSVIGFAEILAGELCGPLGAPQYKEYAEHIRLSGHKLLRMVNQMLEIVRLEGQAAELDPVVEPLDHAIDDALDPLREDIAAKSLTVSVVGEGRLPLVRVDARGLRSVIANLVSNAIAFSPPGGEIRLAAKRTGERVEFTVADDGEGVDPSEIPRLMRPFEQGENALTRSTEGAGLGLPIAKLLCRNMGGALRVRCERGRGLEAIVTLPAG